MLSAPVVFIAHPFRYASLANSIAKALWREGYAVRVPQMSNGRAENRALLLQSDYCVAIIPDKGGDGAKLEASACLWLGGRYPHLISVVKASTREVVDPYDWPEIIPPSNDIVSRVEGYLADPTNRSGD